MVLLLLLLIELRAVIFQALLQLGRRVARDTSLPLSVRGSKRVVREEMGQEGRKGEGRQTGWWFAVETGGAPLRLGDVERLDVLVYPEKAL